MKQNHTDKQAKHPEASLEDKLAYLGGEKTRNPGPMKLDAAAGAKLRWCKSKEKQNP
jgi:hypothetical protein